MSTNTELPTVLLLAVISDLKVIMFVLVPPGSPGSVKFLVAVCIEVVLLTNESDVGEVDPEFLDASSSICA